MASWSAPMTDHNVASHCRWWSRHCSNGTIIIMPGTMTNEDNKDKATAKDKEAVVDGTGGNRDDIVRGACCPGENTPVGMNKFVSKLRRRKFLCCVGPIGNNEDRPDRNRDLFVFELLIQES